MNRARIAVVGAFVAAALVGVVGVVGVVGTASAHEVGLSRSEFTVGDDGVIVAQIDLARAEVGDPAAILPRGVDVSLADADTSANANAAAPCPGTFDGATPTEGDGLHIVATYRCPRDAAAPAAELRLSFAMLDQLARGHRHLCRVTDGPKTHEKLLLRAMPVFAVPLRARGGAIAIALARVRRKTGFAALELAIVAAVLAGAAACFYLRRRRAALSARAPANRSRGA